MSLADGAFYVSVAALIAAMLIGVIWDKRSADRRDDQARQIANLQRDIAAARQARDYWRGLSDFWRGEYERVVACWIDPDPDEARRAAIHRLARKVEAKRRAA